MTNLAWQMAEVAKAAAIKAASGFINENPAAGNYKISPVIRAVRKSPRGFGKQPIDLVESFLVSRIALIMPLKDIMANLSTKWHPYQLPKNYMYRPLATFQLRQIQELLTKSGREINLKNTNSISKIRKALLAQAASDVAEKRIDAVVTFGADYVTVGQKRFPIQTSKRGQRRVKVGRNALSLEGLQQLLGTPDNFSPTL
jgi:hypothetical protein